MAGCSICKHQGKGENEFPCCDCVHNAREHFEPYTNADRIRSMSDEELAEYLETLTMICSTCIYQNEDCAPISNEKCRDGILSWLKSEVKE